MSDNLRKNVGFVLICISRLLNHFVTVRLNIESRKADMQRRRDALAQAAQIFDHERKEFAEDTVLLCEER